MFYSSIMSKTIRRQPKWARDDDRWLKKGGRHTGPSRKKDKQQLFRQAEEDYDNFNYRR